MQYNPETWALTDPTGGGQQWSLGARQDQGRYEGVGERWSSVVEKIPPLFQAQNLRVGPPLRAQELGGARVGKSISEVTALHTHSRDGAFLAKTGSLLPEFSVSLPDKGLAGSMRRSLFNHRCFIISDSRRNKAEDEEQKQQAPLRPLGRTCQNGLYAY